MPKNRSKEDLESLQKKIDAHTEKLRREGKITDAVSKEDMEKEKAWNEKLAQWRDEEHRLELARKDLEHQERMMELKSQQRERELQRELTAWDNEHKASIKQDLEHMQDRKQWLQQRGLPVTEEHEQLIAMLTERLAE